MIQTIKPTPDMVKYLGRTLCQDGILWLALSGSGIEFVFQGRKLSLLLQGDDHTSADTDHARIAVYVDGIRILDTMVKESQPQYDILNETQAKTCHIRIIKLSEAPMSIVGILALGTDEGASLCPESAKAHKIEFIGDSITCGYGTDDSDLTHTFSTATEDVTKAYAYQAAQLLGADYSMVSYSGYGVYSGFTDTGVHNRSELVAPYYPLVGFSRGTWRGEAVTMKAWDFASYQPELIVLNLGTNDDSYCETYPERQESFMSCYRVFLELVRSKNPQAYILCTYGLMNNRLRPFIEKVIAAFQAETGDRNISYFALPTQTEKDGYVIDYHPSLSTHKRTAEMIAAHIRNIMKW